MRRTLPKSEREYRALALEQLESHRAIGEEIDPGEATLHWSNDYDSEGGRMFQTGAKEKATDETVSLLSFLS